MMIWRYRLRRFIACSSRVLLIGGPAIVGVGVAAWIKSQTGISWWIIGGAMVGVGLLMCQAWFEYRHRTYEPTWAFRFDDRFYGNEIMDARFRAAKALKDNPGRIERTDAELEEIDDLLDFLEDLGFYQRGDQISPEVAHHHFYYWIRAYYLAARDYIEAWQTSLEIISSECAIGAVVAMKAIIRLAVLSANIKSGLSAESEVQQSDNRYPVDLAAFISPRLS